MSEQQELYDRLWEDFENSSAVGTFTSWLVLQIHILRAYIEGLRSDLRRARASQGVPRERHQALERERDRLYQLLQQERVNNAAPPNVRPPRPVIEPHPGTTPLPVVPYDPPGTADPNPWTTPGTAGPFYATDNDPRGGPDEGREQSLFETIRGLVDGIQEPAQDSDSGES